MTFLTSQQVALLSLARKKGFLSVSDADTFYSTAKHRRAALSRLVGLGFLALSNKPNVFLYVRSPQ